MKRPTPTSLTFCLRYEGGFLSVPTKKNGRIVEMMPFLVCVYDGKVPAKMRLYNATEEDLKKVIGKHVALFRVLSKNKGEQAAKYEKDAECLSLTAFSKIEDFIDWCLQQKLGKDDRFFIYLFNK